jgi:signal transduction histidine kinase
VTGLGLRLREIHQASRTVRARLALLYAGGFFVSGLVLLAIPASFVRSGSTSSAAIANSGGPVPNGVTEVVRIQHLSDVHRALVGSAVALVVLVAVSAVLGWWLAGRLLRRLRTITETAREISATSLHQRLSLAGPDDEFKELGATLDELFGRLEASFDSQTRFVANASHELRTPLAAERTLLQVALADPDADVGTLRTACQQVLVLGETQERLIDALLTLATSERGIERRELCDLGDITAAALRDRWPFAQQRSLQVDTALAAAQLVGDPQLLESLVANLVDNAIRHNVDGGRIEVFTSSGQGRATLRVRNTGPIIPPDQLAPLLQPFQRLGADRVAHTEGHGLGLTIAQSIASAHGAEFVIAARPEGGLDLSVDFPAP